MTDSNIHTEESQLDNEIRVGAKVRALRRELNMTLQDVAEKSGLSAGFISLVERDMSYPSLTTLMKIARAVQTSVQNLVIIPEGSGEINLAKDRKEIEVIIGNVRYARLNSQFEGSVMNAFEITLPPHYSSQVATHTGEEFFFILEGTLTQTLGEVEKQMQPGDAAHFQSNLPHMWSNPSDLPVRILWVGDIPIK
ncbi:MAG: cupin domain-containing protein [Paracoccaceae bacterium]